jgi:hypothetical protein
MDNILIKKENIIHNLKLNFEEPKIFFEKELYVLEPNKALMYINDELFLYKNLYKSVLNNIEDLKEIMCDNEKNIKVF